MEAGQVCANTIIWQLPRDTPTSFAAQRSWVRWTLIMAITVGGIRVTRVIPVEVLPPDVA